MDDVKFFESLPHIYTLGGFSLHTSRNYDVSAGNNEHYISTVYGQSANPSSATSSLA